MSKPPNKDLESLQDEWYQKLKDDGFTDIEQDENRLKVWHSHFFRVSYASTSFKAKEAYYQAAGRFLYDHPFENLFERTIWGHHAEGMSIRKIADKLNKLGYKTQRDEVHKILQRLTKVMLSTMQEDQDE